MVANVKDEPSIKFESGAIRSDRTGKGRYDLISPFGLRELALVYQEGAVHRGDRNWEKGFPISNCIDSAERHIEQFKQRMDDERHAAQACWNLFAAVHFLELIRRGRLSAELDDRPDYGKPPEEHGRAEIPPPNTLS